MTIKIDQSGKVEKSGKSTFVSDSLGHTVQITSVEKRHIQALYRQTGRPRMFVFEVFSALAAILIRYSYKKMQIYVIDTEYINQDNLLRQLILKDLQALKIYADPDQIRFSAIGKISKAHTTVYFTYKKKKGYTAINVYSEVLSVIIQ